MSVLVLSKLTADRWLVGPIHGAEQSVTDLVTQLVSGSPDTSARELRRLRSLQQFGVVAGHPVDDELMNALRLLHPGERVLAERLEYPGSGQ